MLDNIKLIRKNIKYANIKVKPDLDVIFTAPLNMALDEINKIISKRTDWILKQLRYFKRFPKATQTDLVSGEDFRYLGSSYRLKVIESAIEEVKLADCYLIIALKDKDDFKKKQLLVEEWYHMRAKECFATLINKYQPIVGKEISKVSIRKMKTRWGSCNPVKAYINLNLELIKHHQYAVEYVVFHELVHLIHYNHDKHFYNYLGAHMPDWRLRKNALNQPSDSNSTLAYI